MRALSDKGISGGKDLGPVYLDLLANHWSDGVVELGHAADHAFACGYTQERTWRDRMQALEGAGFIKTVVGGNKKYAKVLLVHPSVAMQRLRDSSRVPDSLWTAYRDQQMKVGESASEVVLGRGQQKQAVG